MDFPISPYAFTKKSCELMIHTYSHLYDINAICLRFFTVYGPRQRPDLAIHKFIKAIYSGDNITLFGDGSTSRDYTYVDDIIEGTLRSYSYITQNDGYEIINIGSDNPVSLSTLVNILESTTGKTALKITLPMQSGDVNRTFADISKAAKCIGYEVKYDIHKGIGHFHEWFLERL